MSPRSEEDAPHGFRTAPVQVPIAWEALEDAFENNAPEVHSYLHLETGEVIRIVDGIADPAMHRRVMGDGKYLRIDPVSSREQYRWMERFIATVDEVGLRQELLHAIDGKGAFRRFKDVLIGYPVDRERWFTFRSERLRACMEAWCVAHDIEAVERPEWRVPSAEEVSPTVEQGASVERVKPKRAATTDARRAKIREAVEALPARELDAALAFMEFLRQRKHTPRASAKRTAPSSKPAEEPEAPAGPAGDTEGEGPA